MIIWFGQSAYPEEFLHISHGSHVLHIARVSLHSAKAEKCLRHLMIKQSATVVRICFHVPVRDFISFLKMRFSFRSSQLPSFLYTAQMLRSHFYKKSPLLSFAFYHEVRTSTINFYPMEVLKLSGILQEAEQFLNSGQCYVLLQFSDQSTLWLNLS